MASQVWPMVGTARGSPVTSVAASSTSVAAPMATALVATGCARGKRLITTFDSAIEKAPPTTASMEMSGTASRTWSPKMTAIPASAMTVPTRVCQRKRSRPWATARRKVKSGTNARMIWARPAPTSTRPQYASPNVMPKPRMP